METDRLLRDFVAIEDVHHREREIENIESPPTTRRRAKRRRRSCPRMIRKYPNVYVLRDFSDHRSLEDADRRSARRRPPGHHDRPRQERAEALLRMLQLKVPQKEFASVVTAVLCTRLIRKLCDSCKVAYAPTPDLLKKLGIPQARSKRSTACRSPRKSRSRAKNVAGVGFKGRTGIFELLVVDDKMPRGADQSSRKLDLLTKAARLAGMRPFQEEGLLLVAKGVTSLAELQRVLKE